MNDMTLTELLEMCESVANDFYTATMTNALSRDQNKATKKALLELLSLAVEKSRGAK